MPVDDRSSLVGGKWRVRKHRGGTPAGEGRRLARGAPVGEAEVLREQCRVARQRKVVLLRRSVQRESSFSGGIALLRCLPHVRRESSFSGVIALLRCVPYIRRESSFSGGIALLRCVPYARRKSCFSGGIALLRCVPYVRREFSFFGGYCPTQVCAVRGVLP